jgi:hypothetical protein
MTSINVSGKTQIVTVKNVISNVINVDKTEVALSVVNKTRTVVVPKTFSNVVKVITAGPQGAYTNLIAPLPAYDANGVLIRIDYSNGYAKVFGYDADGYLITVDFYQPGLSTQRKTLTWVDGQWRGTSAPVVI